MINEGDWPQAFWMIADGMAGNGETEDGAPVAELYFGTLGCE